MPQANGGALRDEGLGELSEEREFKESLTPSLSFHTCKERGMEWGMITEGLSAVSAPGQLGLNGALLSLPGWVGLCWFS